MEALLALFLQMGKEGLSEDQVSRLGQESRDSRESQIDSRALFITYAHCTEFNHYGHAQNLRIIDKKSDGHTKVVRFAASSAFTASNLYGTCMVHGSARTQLYQVSSPLQPREQGKESAPVRCRRRHARWRHRDGLDAAKPLLQRLESLVLPRGEIDGL
jgi:hypothetical protein